MNLREWTNCQGVQPRTAYRWIREGALTISAPNSGRLILVGDLEAPASNVGDTALYARVSSGNRRADLERQVNNVSAWVTSDGHCINRTVTDIGSGPEWKPPKVSCLPANSIVTTIVVEHLDHFVTFCSEYEVDSSGAHVRRLTAIDGSEVDADLVRDMTEIFTSFFACPQNECACSRRAAKTLAAAQKLTNAA
jgi:putative resolvase